MVTIFWAGKLSLLMKCVMNINNLLSWIMGNTKDTNVMKQRMKFGYEGKYSSDVTRYDELGFAHYTKIANELLSSIEVQNKMIVDIGCGTGILSLLALEKEPSYIMCGDISEYMLSQCRAKLSARGYDSNQVNYRVIDAEDLPFDDDTYDLAVSSMVLGLTPNQTKFVSEMSRIVKPGGYIAIATHAPLYDAEVIDAALRLLPKRFVLGYRIEYWPLNEERLKKICLNAGLTDIRTRPVVWKEYFNSGEEIYDYFVATSSGWWYSKFPADKIAEAAEKTKRSLDRKGMKQLTQGIVIAYGKKQKILL